MKSNKLSKILVCFMLSFVMILMAACSGVEDASSAEVKSIDLRAKLMINVDETFTLQATLTPFGSTAKITWKSSDTSVATVSDKGVVKGITEGVAIIRATAGEKSANCTVTVVDPSNADVNVSSVKFNTGVLNLDLEENKTAKLTATVLPENATDKTLTWSSSKPAVASVENDGSITALTAGKTIVTATAHNGEKATCVVTVVGEGSEEEATPLYVRKVSALEGRDDFIMGMDASAVPSLEDAGVEYKNFDGEKEDVFKILKDNGITDIRIRIWNYPYQDGHYGDVAYSYGGGNCDVENAIAISNRCKLYDLGVIIDFHYSDFWADPGKQSAPKAWANKSVEERKTAIYEFTKESMQKIKDTGVKITMVQIGNETTRAICEADYGSAPATYCAYINQGAKAVREVTGTVANGGAKVAIHLTNPESRDYAGYATTFKNNNVDYDVFGSSYYPFWHGTLDNLTSKLMRVHEISGKEVMVLETSYAFTDEDFDKTGNTALSTRTKPFTVQGQANAVLDVIDAIAGLGDYGLGICYWEGTWVAPALNRADTMEKCNATGCGWASAKSGPASIGGDGYQQNDVKSAGGVVIDNQAFFSSIDFTALESLKLFKLAKDGQIVDWAADYIYEEELFYTVDEGTVTLPQKVTVVLNSDSTVSTDALWDVDLADVAEFIHTVKEHVVYGTTIYGGVAKCTVYVQNKNLLVDGSFEDTAGYPQTDNKIDVPLPWKVNRISSNPEALQLYVSNEAQNAKMGTNSFHFWDSAALEFELYQEVDLAKAIELYNYGIFSFSVDFSGGDCGDNQEIYSFAIITYNDGKEAVTVRGDDIRATGWQQWHRTAVNEIVIDSTVASVKVGIHIKTDKTDNGGWGNIDNAQFFFKSSASND